MERSGAHISAEDWSPGPDFRTDAFYFYTVFTDRKEFARLGGGVVGFFAVNKSSGEVFDAVLVKRVRTKALAAMQADLRNRHCISREMVAKGRGTGFAK